MYAAVNAGVYTYIPRFTSALVHMCLKTRGQSFSGILRNAIYLHWDNLSLTSNSKLVKNDCWPESSREPPGSTSRALELHACISTRGIFTWVLVIKSRPSNISASTFTTGISPAFMLFFLLSVIKIIKHIIIPLNANYEGINHIETLITGKEILLSRKSSRTWIAFSRNSNRKQLFPRHIWYLSLTEAAA